MTTDREQLVTAVAGHLHAGQRFDAARLIATFSGQNPKVVRDENIALEYCFSLLQWCLDNNHYEWAAEMLWTPVQFNCKPRCTRMAWHEIATNQALFLQGAASMSKSYGGGGWMFLDWVRDPVYTNIKLVGPSEQHLKDNFFSHLVTLHRDATLPLPGIIGDLFIGLDPRARKSAISGVVIPLGKKAAGRLQGVKRVPRKHPDPRFGMMSRLRIFVDEAEETPIGMWKDVNNILSNFDGDVEGFKLVMAYNPRDINSEVAKRAEPPQGWDELKAETDEVWTSKRGWRVLRLDGAKCENVVAGKIIYPGLQTKTGFDKIIQDSGGLDTPAYWTMCRGMYPKASAIFTIISTLLVNKMRGGFMFGEDPEPFGGCDLSLEGGDPAVFAHGLFGRAVGYRKVPSLDYPKGQEVFFTDKEGRRILRHALQVKGLITLAPGDTVFMAEQVKKTAEGLHIPPGNLMLDRTGNGAGTHDLLKNLWSNEVRGVNYSEGATERKIMEEDTKTAKEEYERVVSELWFAFKRWGEYGFIRFDPAALLDVLIAQLTGRRYMPGKLTKVEGKPEWKARGNGSPNEADAVALLLHAVRIASRVIPSASQECAGFAIGSSKDGRGEVPCRVDCTNKFDDLDGHGGPEGW